MITKRKKVLTVFFISIFAVCLLAVTLFNLPTTAYASNNSNGTNTKDEWNGSQTTENLIYVSDGTGDQSTKSLAEFGWQNIGNVYPYSRYYTHSDVDLNTESYGWGIQAQNGSDDIGNSSYGNGVWYRITLSEADRVKANKGDLTVSASSVNYRQTAATHQVSLKLFFDNAAGEQIDSIEIKESISSSAYQLNITDETVPENTASIRYYVSNRGSLGARPFIGGLSCTLSDKTAPAAVNSVLAENPTITARGGAIAGDTVEYSVVFDEKVTVKNSGTAKISVAGTSVEASSYALTESNGVSSVTYKFTIPEVAQNGTVSFSGVTNCVVADEAGNESTINYTGSPDTLTYYKQMTVSSDLSKLSIDGGNTAIFGTDYTVTLRADKGYELPKTVEITVGSSPISGGGYSYSSNDGSITIYGSYIKGDIVIKAAGTAKESAVTFDKQGGSGGTDSVTAAYDGNMPDITAPSRTGYTFAGYYSESGDSGTKYYDEAGKGIKNCDFDEPITLYAHWIANKYTIEFDGNKPANASGSVAGSMSAEERTYDGGEISLLGNAFKLTGWTFEGWAESKSGGVVYTDGQAVENLTSEQNGTAVLYAVWKPNNYTVNYDGNKPADASAEIIGKTDSSAHVYDAESALSTNGYTLKGWTFQGWSASKGGEVDYNDGADIKNLTYEAGGSVTLYAVWKANVYEVNYEANQPSGTSGAVGGSMAASQYTYDTAGNLNDNNYTLTGWTFCGWSLDPNAVDAQFTDGDSVLNLTDADNGEVTLYAVWKANNYSVIYNNNKPANASSDVEGGMENSVFTYDTESVLTANGYTLKGWTFLGWATTKGGNAVYTDGESIVNLTASADGEVTLYAVWEENSHTVSFDTEGGGRAESVSAEYDNKLPNVTPPARKGYNFGGYFTLPGGEGEQYYDASGEAYLGLTYTVDGDITLYACWTPIHYNIELYSMGEYVGVIEDVMYGKLRLPSAETLGIERENYDFIGWNLYDGQNWSMYSADTDYIAGLADTDGETVVIYAAWLEKERYTVSFDANGGIGAPALTEAHEGETIVLSDTIPVRENYTFLGWAVTADAEEAQYQSGGEFTMDNSVVTLYAVWKQNPSLSYDANGGAFSGTPELSYPAAGGTVIITSLIPEREGYVFEGWSTKKAADSAEYESGSEFVMPDADTVLYAVWKNAQYKVTVTVSDGYEIAGLNGQYYFEDTASFSVTGTAPKVYINGQLVSAGENGQYTFIVKGDTHIFVADGSKLSLIYSANGGTGAPVDNNAYNTDGTASVSEAVPSRPGYTFTGWATDPEAVEAEYHAEDTILFAGEDIILYAVWQANSYTVNYNANGGEGSMDPDSFIYGIEGILSENTFSKEGHIFVGWATEIGGEAIYADGETVSDLCAENNGEITLYAVWKQTVTVITFETEGGTNVNEPVSVVYGGKLSSAGLIVPARGGYVFSGYYTERNGKGIMIFDAELNVAGDYLTKGWDMNVGELTLYPHWIPVSYTVIYMNGQEKLGGQSAVYGVPFNLTSADSLGIIAPEGKHFAGWTTAPSGQIALYADGQSVTDGLTQTDGGEVLLYAVFEADEKFTVSYNANGGSNAPVDGNKYLAGGKVIISRIIPEKEGYIFIGWSYDPNGEEIAFPYEDGKFETDSVTMPKGGITLYAVWAAGETLQSQIDALKKNAGELSAAIAALEKADGEFNAELDELGAALKAAQDAIDSLDDTFATDAELNAAATELKGLLTEAQKGLEEKISQVQKNLDSAVSRLEGLIGGNSDDIEELNAALAAMETAYENADAVINGKIAGLEGKDAELTESISALESAYKAADAALRESIDGIKNELESEVKRLEGLIASNGGEIDGLEAALDNLETAYKAADALINSEIGALKDKDTELGESISELDSAYKTADAALQQAIENLERELEEAVSSLTGSIAENQAEFESKLSAVENAYKAADALINSDIGSLKNKDTELAESIAALEQAYKAADKALQESIDGVKSKLNAEVARLEGLIKSGTGDISELEKAIEDLNAAYKAADTLINSEIADLKNQDEAIRTSIAALESAYKTADEALWAGIREVQNNLDALQAENDNASVIYMIINISLAGVAAVLIVTLIIKAVKRRKTEK